MIGTTIASAIGGTVMGYAVGDAMGAIPTKVAVPAVSNASTPKATADGKPVGNTQTARQSLFTSALIVVAGVAVLIFGDRFLKDARIG